MIDERILERIHKARNIGIATHIRPDGDAIGSVLGMGLALQAVEKNVQMVLRDGLSNTFKHLSGSDQFKQKFEDECDLYIVLDCSDMRRTGGVFEEKTIGLAVDHHITNENFAELNYVNPDAVATCAILAEKMPAWGLTINHDIACALLTGILSDSIGFRTSNTTSKSLRIAADLMDHGANITELYNKALLSRSFEATNYWGFALSRLQRNNGLVWTSLSLEDRKASGYSGNDDADLTNVLSSIDPFDVAVLFIEQKPDDVKVSWRARAGLDISRLATSFGGGGHPAAAGADVKGTLEDVQKSVLEATGTFLKQIQMSAKKEVDNNCAHN
jgi:phosphoesterase RecJ-like protein